ncbi:MFS transporter [Rhodoferax sp.]|uniref:MFS transporter n=1 Tax=Rhodoferax sp. TaxID=50421 RepID=UPI00374DAB4A
MKTPQLSDALKQLYADRNFRLYTVASVTSWLCFFVQNLATSWLTWQISRSPGTLGLVTFLDTVPYFLFGPWASVLADRHDRFKMLFTAYFFALIQALLLVLASCTGWLNVPVLATLAFLHGTVHAFSVPAAYGLLPRAVERKNLSAAIAFSSSYRTLALFLGPALAGVLLANFPIYISFLVNALAYALYLVVLKRMRLPPAEPVKPSGNGVYRDYLEGLQYALRHPLIAVLLAMTFFNDGLRGLTGRLLPIFADRLFSVGTQGLAVLAGATGLGAAIASISLSKNRDPKNSWRITQFGFATAIVTTVLFVSTTTPWLAVTSRVLFGLAAEAALTSNLILLQSNLDDRFRSRVMGNAFLVSQTASLSLVAIGPISALIGLNQMMYGFAGLALVALAMFWVFFRRRERVSTDWHS